MAAAALLPTAAGCAAVGERLTAGDLSVLVGEASDGGDDALLEGAVEPVGGCLGVAGKVVVWPHGTEVEKGSPFRLRLPGRKAPVGLGDQVRLAGGMALEHPQVGAPAGNGPAEVGGVTVPAECAAHDVWLSALQ